MSVAAGLIVWCGVSIPASLVLGAILGREHEAKSLARLRFAAEVAPRRDPALRAS